MSGYWHWHQDTYLTCELLAAWQHQFGGRAAGSAFLGKANFRLRQIHSGVVLPTTAIAGETAGDGLLATAPNQALWVCSADCVPVLIGCVQTGRVAALHAGWRGTAAQIIPTAIQKLCHQGSSCSSLRIALGPAISGKNYQVQQEVVAALAATVVNSDLPTIEAVIRQWQRESALLQPDGERWRVDLRRVQREQLLQVGIAPAQIAISPHCTYEQGERFYSYRRDGKTQVQLSGIVSRSAPQ